MGVVLSSEAWPTVPVPGVVLSSEAWPTVPVPVFNFTNHTVNVGWQAFPGKVLPDLDSLHKSDVHLRNNYFISLTVLTMVSYMAIGTVSVVVVNAGKGSPKGYSEFEEESRMEKRLKGVGFLVAVVVLYFAFVASLLQICHQHQSISMHKGAAWEFWYAWLNFGMIGGLLEVFLLRCLPGKRSMFVYAETMVLKHLPLLSEPVDSAKDMMFAFVAMSAGDPFIGFAALLLLVMCHVFFIRHRDVKGELMESYLPILNSKVTESNPAIAPLPPTESSTYSYSPLTVSVEDPPPTDRSSQKPPIKEESYQESVKSQVTSKILKQASPARYQITLYEDLPQCILMFIFAVRHGSGLFVLASIGLSIARLVVAGPLGLAIHKCLLSGLKQERTQAAAKGNAFKVLSLTLQIWKVDTKDQATDLPRFFDISEVKDQASLVQLILAQYKNDALKKAGFSITEIVEGLKEAGLEDKNQILNCVNDAGFSKVELVGVMKVAGFNTDEAAQWIIDEARRKSKGSGFDQVTAITEAGFGAELIAQGMTDAGFERVKIITTLSTKFGNFDLTKAGFSITEIVEALKEAGLKKERILNCVNHAGFSKVELVGVMKVAGFNTDEAAHFIESRMVNYADRICRKSEEKGKSDLLYGLADCDLSEIFDFRTARIMERALKDEDEDKDEDEEDEDEDEDDKGFWSKHIVEWLTDAGFERAQIIEFMVIKCKLPGQSSPLKYCAKPALEVGKGGGVDLAKAFFKRTSEGHRGRYAFDDDDDSSDEDEKDDVQELACGLKRAGCQPLQIVQNMHAAGWSAQEIARALKTACDPDFPQEEEEEEEERKEFESSKCYEAMTSLMNSGEAAQALRQAGMDLEKIIEGMVLGGAGKGNMAHWIKNSWAPGDVGKIANKGYFTLSDVKLLERQGFKRTEISQLAGVSEFYDFTPKPFATHDEIAKEMKQKGYSMKQINNYFVDHVAASGGKTMQVYVREEAFRNLGYTNEQIAGELDKNVIHIQERQKNKGCV